MKKFITLFLAAMTAFPAVYTQPAKVGGGLMLSSAYHFHNADYDFNKSGNLALTLKHVHKISLPVEFAPSFVFFYPHILKNLYERTTINTMIFDIDGHYIFNSLDKYKFYGLAGLDILLAWKKDRYFAAIPNGTTGTTGPAEEVIYKERDKALGLNLGVGTYMKITNQFEIYGEAKYVFSKYNQLMLNVGVLLNIDWMKKHENSEL